MGRADFVQTKTPILQVETKIFAEGYVRKYIPIPESKNECYRSGETDCVQN